MKEPLIVLTGPTASGKTALSIELAKAIGGEIISADSMQVYRQMDIGTAKIRPEEMEGIPHYLVDVLEPDDPFNVVVFQQMAKAAMKKIRENGHIPIIVGGTGFYIQAILNDIDFKENEDDGYRSHLEAMAASDGGPERLYEMLKEVDPESTEKIHCHNTKRVIRALEYFHQTGQKISEHNEQESRKESPYNFAYFVLNRPREVLYERIDQRVDQMMEEGLVQEVRKLKDRGYDRSLVSMQGLGYKELVPAIRGDISLDEAVCTLKRDTRHFAKRQLTWFRREKDVCYLDKDIYKDTQQLLTVIKKELKNKDIL